MKIKIKANPTGYTAQFIDDPFIASDMLIPLPYTAKADPSQVVKAIEVLNPNHTVTLETT